MRHERGAKQHDRHITGKRRQAVRALAQPYLHQAANHQRCANGDDDQRHGFCPLHRLDGELFHQNAHQRRQHNGQQQGQRQRQAQLDKHHRQHATQHDEFTLGKVDHMAGVVNQGEPQRRQRVGGPHRQAGKQKLQQLRQHHALPAGVGMV